MRLLRIVGTWVISDQESLLSDVDRVLASTSTAKRLAVMEHLTRGIEGKALVELSSRLAVMEGAPAETISHLSSNDDIAVSGPELKASKAGGG